MKVPARCNKRECQARRNLSMLPEQYIHAPRCHMPGCNGLMYVDKYRLRQGPHDNPPVCKKDCLYFPHRINTKGCVSYEEYTATRNSGDRSIHCPTPEEDRVPF